MSKNLSILWSGAPSPGWPPIELKSPTGLAQAWSNGEDRFLGARAQFLCRDVPLAIVECRRWTLVGRHWAPLPRLGTGHIGTGQRYQPTKTAHFNSRPACAYIHKDGFKTAQFEPSLESYCLLGMSQFTDYAICKIGQNKE